jgi:hypothetical protein
MHLFMKFFIHIIPDTSHHAIDFFLTNKRDLPIFPAPKGASYGRNDAMRDKRIFKPQFVWT